MKTEVKQQAIITLESYIEIETFVVALEEHLQDWSHIYDENLKRQLVNMINKLDQVARSRP